MLNFCSKCRGCSTLQPLHILQNLHRLVLYSTSTTTTTNGPVQSFADYLVHSLGFSQQQALSTCSKISHPTKKVINFTPRSAAKASSVIDFLKGYGFDDARIRKVVSLYPPILSASVDRTLKPKFKVFQDMGISESDIICVISANPKFVSRDLSPLIQSLRAVVGSDEKLIGHLKKCNLFMSASSLQNLVANVAFLENDYGIPIDVIRSNFLLQPSAYFRSTEFFRNVAVMVEEELGIPRDSRMFLYGVYLLCGHSKTAIESKCQVLKSFGWPQVHVHELMRKSPFSFLKSRENMKKKLIFLVKELGYEPAFLASHSALFTYSLEKRLRPRYKVLSILKEKGLLDYNFYSAALHTETKFLKRIIQPFEEAVPGLHELYQNSKACSESVTDFSAR